VSATWHHESIPPYVEFSIFSERNVGTNLFIWYYENGTVVILDEPFANGEEDVVDLEDIDDPIDTVTSIKRQKRQIYYPRSAKLKVKVAYDESFKEQVDSIKKIETYWLRAQVHMQVLFCLKTFETKVEIERVDDIKHYNEFVNGADEVFTPDMEKFTMENLDKNADLMVYMTKDKPGNVNTENKTIIGRAVNEAACNPKRRRHAHSITEWNESTNFFGGVLAHEIAHNIGVRHDFNKDRTARQGCDSNNSIMNYVDSRKHWSKCSVNDFRRRFNLLRNKWCMDFEINKNRCSGIRERKPRIEIIGPTFDFAGEPVPGKIIIHNTTDTYIDPTVLIDGGINTLDSDSAGKITIF
jgi:hypothetical protein